MNREAKETISFRVNPELKRKLNINARRNGFTTLSQYLEQLAEHSTQKFGVGKLNQKDLQLIRRAMQTEFEKERKELIDFIRTEYERLSSRN